MVKVAFLSLAMASVVALLLAATIQEQGKQVQKSAGLAAVAAQAKAAGKNEVRLPLLRVSWGGEADTQKALATHSVIIGKAISASASEYNDHSIVTWFRFSREETLSDRGRKASIRKETVPQEFAHLSSNEFLVAVPGGTISFNGVMISQPYSFPPFIVGQSYLLVASIDDEGIARLNYGPSEVMVVDDSGELHPLVQNQAHPGRDRLVEEIGNSRFSARQALKQQQ